MTFPSDRTLRHPALGSLQLSSQQTVTVSVLLHYDTADPFMCRIECLGPQEREWTFSLDLLLGALKASQGDDTYGAVFLKPIGKEYISIRHRSSQGQFILLLGRGDVLLFVSQANGLRRQAHQPDIDRELQQLLGNS